MGKYEYKQHENTHNGSHHTILTWVANELAEANRLKRLELCLLQVTSGLTQQTIDDVFDHDRELEDQA